MPIYTHVLGTPRRRARGAAWTPLGPRPTRPLYANNSIVNTTTNNSSTDADTTTTTTAATTTATTTAAATTTTSTTSTLGPPTNQATVENVASRALAETSLAQNSSYYLYLAYT